MKKIFYLPIMFLLALVTACSSDDKPVDQFLNERDNGGAVRQVTLINNTIDSSTNTGSLEVFLEYIDAEDNSLLETLNVYTTFTDFSEAQGDSSGSLEGEEVLITAIPASAFTQSSNNPPQYTLRIDLDEFLTATENTVDGIASPDVFATRLEVVLTDGRIFTNTNSPDLGIANGVFEYATQVN